MKTKKRAVIIPILVIGLLALGFVVYEGFLGPAQYMPNEALFEAIENRDVQQADDALRNGADIHALVYPEKAGLLGEFVYYNHTPLIRACRMDDIAMVELLLAWGADVNMADPWVNQTPLEWTLSNNKTDKNANRFAIARILIDHGAEINVGVGFRTPMECVRWTYDSDSEETLRQGEELYRYMLEISN